MLVATSGRRKAQAKEAKNMSRLYAAESNLSQLVQ